MKRHWRQILVGLASALGSALLASLLKERDQDPANPAPKTIDDQPASQRRASGLSGGRRDQAVGFLSDVLAEAYRKINAERKERR